MRISDFSVYIQGIYKYVYNMATSIHACAHISAMAVPRRQARLEQLLLKSQSF